MQRELLAGHIPTPQLGSDSEAFALPRTGAFWISRSQFQTQLVPYLSCRFNSPSCSSPNLMVLTHNFHRPLCAPLERSQVQGESFAWCERSLCDSINFVVSCVSPDLFSAHNRQTSSRPLLSHHSDAFCWCVSQCLAFPSTFVCLGHVFSSFLLLFLPTSPLYPRGDFSREPHSCTARHRQPHTHTHSHTERQTAHAPTHPHTHAQIPARAELSSSLSSLTRASLQLAVTRPPASR